jgi:hypothetical protein
MRAVDRDRYRAAPLQTWRAGAVSQPRLDAPAHRDDALDAVDPADELSFRTQVGAWQRQRVGDPNDTLDGGERGLQHVAVGPIATRHPRGDLGLELEPSAALGVEDRPEDAGRIEVRQAQPVDRPVSRYQRDRSSVPDRGVVAKRDIAPRGGSSHRSYARLMRTSMCDSWRTEAAYTWAGRRMTSAGRSA